MAAWWRRPAKIQVRRSGDQWYFEMPGEDPGLEYIARGVYTRFDGWQRLDLVQVHEHHRRRGLATDLIAEMVNHAGTGHNWYATEAEPDGRAYLMPLLRRDYPDSTWSYRADA